jgi:hypothetical protein
MQLSEHFSYEELTRSETAERNGWLNIPLKCGEREPNPSRGSIGEGQGCGRGKTHNDQLWLPGQASQ